MVNDTRLEVKDSKSRIVTGDLVLDRITRNTDGTATVIGRVDGEPFSVPMKPTALQSFPKFQATLFAAVGMWPRNLDVEYTVGRRGREIWNDDVASAMGAGR